MKITLLKSMIKNYLLIVSIAVVIVWGYMLAKGLKGFNKYRQSTYGAEKESAHLEYKAPVKRLLKLWLFTIATFIFLALWIGIFTSK